MRILITVSAGELVDRLTILELKRQRLPPAVRPEIEREIAELAGVQERELPTSEHVSGLRAKLAALNAELWDLEDALRECECSGSFGERFVALARSVYRTNDERAAIKRKLDEVVGSERREHKSHALPSL